MLVLIALQYVLRWSRTLRAEGVWRLLALAKHAVLLRVFRLMMLIPSNRQRVEREMAAAMKDISKSVSYTHLTLPTILLV